MIQQETPFLFLTQEEKRTLGLKNKQTSKASVDFREAEGQVTFSMPFCTSILFFGFLSFFLCRLVD